MAKCKEKGCQISSVREATFGDYFGGLSQICSHLLLYLHAAFHSLWIRANARVRGDVVPVSGVQVQQAAVALLKCDSESDIDDKRERTKGTS
ncbi:hypothetical protein PAMP_022390 [Pampus punctatissimus]